jgi:DNA-binding NarL/FixJ family response regulator
MTHNKRRARVLLADDNREMIEAVKTIIGADYEIVGAVNDGLQLVKAEESLEPDIGIIDISMPVMNGIAAAGEIAKRGSAIKIIFLTVNEDRDFVRAAFECGGLGYVIKRQMATDLPTALEEALAGRRFVSPGCDEPNGLGHFNGLDD